MSGASIDLLGNGGVVSLSGWNFKLNYVSDDDFSECPMLKFTFAPPDLADHACWQAVRVDTEIDTVEGVN